MISFVVRDGRHFMVHLKIKRTAAGEVELLPTPQSVHYICFNIPELSAQLQWQMAGKVKSKNGKDKRVIPKKASMGHSDC